MIESNQTIVILPILKSFKLLSLLNFEWSVKFYFLHMKSDEVENFLKQTAIVSGNVKNLSKRIENEI